MDFINPVFICNYRHNKVQLIAERCTSETTFSETESQMNKKEDNMSIVGILLCKYGILAIGDSKATATTKLG